MVEHLLATHTAWVRFSLGPNIFIIYFICSFFDFSVTDKMMIFRSQPTGTTPTPSPTPTPTPTPTPEFLRYELFNAIALKRQA